MRIEDGGGGSRKPSGTPVQKPVPQATSVRSPGTKFALKNDAGVRRASTPIFDGARAATAYQPGSRFALKNDGGARTPSPSAPERLRAAADGVPVATAYQPGSKFALKNDGAGGGGTVRPGLTDREALAIAGKVHDAMFGDLVGTREGQAFAALRGLSPAEAREVAYQYEIKYKGLDPEHTSPGAFQVQGSLLYTRLQNELQANAEPGATGHDWAQAQALLRGDTVKADAIALRTALERPWLLPGGRADEILSILRRAEPAERQALVETFAKDFAGRDHTVVRGMAGATQVPGTKMAQYDKDPATLVMNVLKTQLGGGDWTEAVGLITAAKYAAQPEVSSRAQGEATVGRLYSLLDRPLPDRAAALEVLQGLAPEERAFVQGLASGPEGSTKLGQLLQSKLTDAELQQATAYLSGDAASARATALHAALTRTSPTYGYPQPTPDVAAAEKILGELGSDDERRALLDAFARQYRQDPASLIPAVVGASRREVLVAQLRTVPTVLESGATALAGLGAEAVDTGIDYRANVLRLAIDSRLVGVAEDDVRRAFSGLDASQARALAAQPLRQSEPGGRTLGDELGQWYRAGGGGRFTLELQQMLDGDASATGDRQQQIDEAQAQYTLETTGPLVGVNDAVQRLFGNDARTVLDADAARLQAAEAALRGSPSANEPTRADMAVAFMGTGLHDYRTAKEATTEAVKTVVTTAAVVGTTVATAGTAAAVWAPVVAGATANVAATQLNGASNSWQDDAVAVAEGVANGLTLPGSAVTVRGGQYLVREAAEEGGRQVFRSVSRSVAQEAVERGLAEGAEEALARGGQVILRDAGRELTVQAFRPTLAQAIGQNVAEGVTGSIVGDLSAGALRGEVNPQQVAANAVLAAGTAGLLGLGMAGGSRLADNLRGPGATPRVEGVPGDVEHVAAVPATSLPDQVIPVDREIIEVRSLMARPDRDAFVRAGKNPPPEPLGPREVDLVIEGYNRSYAEQGVPVVMARVGDDVVKLQGRELVDAFRAGDADRAAALVRAGEAEPSLHPELAAAVVRGDVRTVAEHLRGDVDVPERIATAPAVHASGAEPADLSTRPVTTAPTAAPRLAVAPLPPKEQARLREQLVRDLQLDADSPAGRNWAFRALGYRGKDVDELVDHVAATRMDTVLTPPGDQAGRLWKNAAEVRGPSGAKARLTVIWRNDPASGGVRLHRVWADMLEAPTPPPEAADATIQAAIVQGMKGTNVAEIGIRRQDPGSRAWHGIGGSTILDEQGRVMGPSKPVLPEVETVDGRPVFPEHAQPGTGAIFPTKPGGSFPWTERAPAVTLGPDEVVSLNAALAAEGKSLYDLYPDLPIPRLVTPPGGDKPVWVQQLSLGGAKPVVADPVRDAAGKVIGGRVLMAVPDLDIAYARGVDGHLLTDAEIMGPNGLKTAINRAYSDARFPGTDYDIVNHGAHFNGLKDPELVKGYDLDAPKYWDEPVYKFAADAGGYVQTKPFGETYRKLVDPAYVPTWQRGLDAPGAAPVGGSSRGPRGAAGQVLATLRQEVSSGARPMTTLDDLDEALSETLSRGRARGMASQGPARTGARDPKAVVERWVRGQALSDPNFRPALLNSLSPYPDLKFSGPLRLRIEPARLEAPVFRTVETSRGPRVQAEVKRSLASLVSDDPAFAAFQKTYATSDVPLTIRVNLPEGAPRTSAEVNRALENAPTVNWFMHGYQSNRAVWEPELARWDDLVEGDSISIAVGGMGAEGHFAGTGASPLTPKQYAFQMLSAMDLLGLGGKQKINVIGHSMGGAAAYEMGRALTSRKVAGLPGQPPAMSFVLLAPALAPDSVSFLRNPIYGSLIRLNNRVGTQAPAALMDLVGKTGVPAAVVDSLLPGAPDALRKIHAGFNDFAQLRATAQGLLSQPHPDPLEVRDFLSRFPTLVVAAGDDRLVDPRVVQRVFGQGNVLLLEGRNHYPHLPQNGVLGEGGQRLLEAARAVLNRTGPLGDRR